MCFIFSLSAIVSRVIVLFWPPEILIVFHFQFFHCCILCRCFLLCLVSRQGIQFALFLCVLCVVWTIWSYSLKLLYGLSWIYFLDLLTIFRHFKSSPWPCTRFCTISCVRPTQPNSYLGPSFKSLFVWFAIYYLLTLSNHQLDWNWIIKDDLIWLFENKRKTCLNLGNEDLTSYTIAYWGKSKGGSTVFYNFTYLPESGRTQVFVVGNGQQVLPEGNHQTWVLLPL